MRGILDRGNHRLATVDTEPAAWTFIREQVKVDLVILELSLKDGSGIGLLRRLRADSQLKGIPVVIYTARANRNDVKMCLESKVQNFLMKPYDEDVVFQEVGKALAAKWRDALFEEERSFCQLMGYRQHDLHGMLRDLRKSVDGVLPTVRQWADQAANAHGDEPSELPDEVAAVREAAEAAGAWGVVSALSNVEAVAKAHQEGRLPAAFESLELAGRMIEHRLDPDIACVGFMNDQEVSEQEHEKLLAVWREAPAQGRCPMMTWDELKPRVEAMTGFPVIDSAAAAFRMTATGQPSCIHPLMDLVARDPGLSTQVLIAVNKAHPAPDARSRIEDARSAVSQLGEMKLAALSRGMITVSQRTLEIPPQFNWSRYWTFVRSVARVSQLICQQMELFSLEPVARTAGELHDIGKLILAHLEPIGFQVIVDEARRQRRPLVELEKQYFDCTTAQLGAHFGQHFGLSERFTQVMRHLANPVEAGEDARLAAVVALARNFCEHAGVGCSGSPVNREETFWADRTPAWEVLQDCVFPSFKLREFERTMLARARGLREELAGRSDTAPILQAV